MITLYNGDCLQKLSLIESDTVDLILTDPPYELGFMGKSWDSTGIANNVEMWRQCLRVLKPGGHLLSFGGTRTYHRMASAIEDAGFEVRDMIEWVYGSGFPKSLNIGKAVDKLQGNEREFLGIDEAKLARFNSGLQNQNDGYDRPWMHREDAGMKKAGITKGTSEWEGWGTALKPAHEPICMARKPLAEKTVAENCLKWGTGGINIDESRVGTEEITIHGYKGDSYSQSYKENGTKPELNEYKQVTGRFPANLIHDNSEEVRECFPESKSIGGIANGHNGEKSLFNIPTGKRDVNPYNGEIGNASRFFKSIIYQAKASKSDRGEGNIHATVKPTKLMEYLINLASKPNATVLDPFMGSGTTGVACKRLERNFIGIEMDESYFKIAESRIENALN